MLLRVLTLIAVPFMLLACSTQSNQDEMSSFEPKYKVSNEDVKKWVIERNKMEQCLYPKSVVNNSVTLPDSQQFLYHMAVYSQTLNQIIGADNYQALMQDPASQQYLASKLQQFKHNKRATFQQVWCNSVKRDYSQAVKQAKESAKKQTALESQTKLAKKTTNSKAPAVKNEKSTQYVKVTHKADNTPEHETATETDMTASGKAEVVNEAPQASGENVSLQQSKEQQGNRIKLTWGPVKKEVYSY